MAISVGMELFSVLFCTVFIPLLGSVRFSLPIYHFITRITEFFMKKRARIIISNSVGNQAADAFVERMLIKAIFSDAQVAEVDDAMPFDELSDGGAVGGFPEMEMNGRGSGMTTVSIIGEIEDADGVINIRYMETEITDMAGATTLVSFSEPGEVTMVRTGSVNTALCFNSRLERRICWYNDSIFPVDVSVITERFKNTITAEKGGVLDVVYTVEMKGLPMENSHFILQVKPIC